MTYAEVTQFGNSGQIHFHETADPVVSDGQLLIEIQSAVSYTHLTLPTNREV